MSENALCPSVDPHTGERCGRRIHHDGRHRCMTGTASVTIWDAEPEVEWRWHDGLGHIGTVTNAETPPQSED